MVYEPALSEKVRVKRREMKLTQAQLAKQSGLTQATISRLESGEVTQLKSDALVRLAKALGVTVDFLVGKEARMEFDKALLSDETAKVIFRGYGKLSENRKRQVMEYVEFLVRQDGKGRS